MIFRAQGASALASQGYPSHQIQAILAFDGSEEAIYRACASISTHLLILSRDKYPNDTRTLEAKYIFSWSGMLLYGQTDLVALSSNRVLLCEGSGASTVYYAADVGSERLIAHPDVKKLPSGNGRAAGIDLSMQGTSRSYRLSSSLRFYHCQIPQSRFPADKHQRHLCARTLSCRP